MATENKKYLDLAGLQHLIDKLNEQKRLVAHPTGQIPVENAIVGPAAVKVGQDANGHVVFGTALQPSDVGVNNSTIKIKVNGTEKSFTTNQAGETTLEFNVNAGDLGVSNALHFIGLVKAVPSGSSVTKVDGTSYAVSAGDVVLYNHREWLYDGATWYELGDEASHALKSITISGDGTYITGGGDLSNNRTLSHKTYDYVEADGPVKIGRDTGGHVIIGGKINVVSDGKHSHNLNASVPANKFVDTVTPTSTKISLNKSTDTFVKSYPGVKSNLVTTTITGTDGTVKASIVKSSSAVNVATTDTAVTVAKRAAEARKIGNANVGSEYTVVTGFTSGNAYSASYSDSDECLTFSALELTTVKMNSAASSSDTIWGCSETDASIIPAKANGSVTNYTFEEVSAAKNGSAITVATGSIATTGTGDNVLVGLGTADTGSAIKTATVQSGTTGDVTVVTEVKSDKNSAAVAISGSAVEAGAHTHGLE